jgi:hypothetical protein
MNAASGRGWLCSGMTWGSAVDLHHENGCVKQLLTSSGFESSVGAVVRKPFALRHRMKAA